MTMKRLKDADLYGPIKWYYLDFVSLRVKCLFMVSNV